MARIQFSLRQLLGLVTLSAFFLSTAYTLGWTVALGGLVVFTLIGGVARLRRTGHVVAACRVVAAVSLGTLWMIAADRSWFRDECQHCGLDLDVIEYRFFLVPLHRTIRPHNATVARIAEDLGHPCPHQFDRWHLTRWWGMLYPACPFFRGTLRLGGGEDANGVVSWYDEQAKEVLLAEQRASPELGEEFFRRAIMASDHFYRRKFFRALWRKRGTLPAPPADWVSLETTFVNGVYATREGLIVAPAPARLPFHEGEIYDLSAPFKFTCENCCEETLAPLDQLLQSNCDWAWQLFRNDAACVAEVFDLTAKRAWFGIDWTTTDGRDVVVGAHECSTCSTPYLVCIEYTQVGPLRYSSILRGVARLEAHDDRTFDK